MGLAPAERQKSMYEELLIPLQEYKDLGLVKQLNAKTIGKLSAQQQQLLPEVFDYYYNITFSWYVATAKMCFFYGFCPLFAYSDILKPFLGPENYVVSFCVQLIILIVIWLWYKILLTMHENSICCVRTTSSQQQHHLENIIFVVTT